MEKDATIQIAWIWQFECAQFIVVHKDIKYVVKQTLGSLAIMVQHPFLDNIVIVSLSINNLEMIWLGTQGKGTRGMGTNTYFDACESVD